MGEGLPAGRDRFAQRAEPLHCIEQQAQCPRQTVTGKTATGWQLEPIGGGWIERVASPAPVHRDEPIMHARQPELLGKWISRLWLRSA